MSVQQSYLYRHNGQDGTLLRGSDDEPYLLETEDGNAYPLAPDDVIILDTPQAGFLAGVDALMGAWKEQCEAAADLADPAAARQTLRECLEVMRQAVDMGGGTDPAPTLAIVRAA